MEASKSTPIYVGIFTVVGLLLLFYIAVYTSVNEGISEARRIAGLFPEAHGLLRGGNVTYKGVRVGTVANIRLVQNEEGDYVARVEMDVEATAPIYADADAVIQAATLLGTMEVAIWGGTAEAGKATLENPLKGQRSVSIDEAISKVAEGVESVKKVAEGLDASQGDFFTKLESVVDENRQNIKDATEAFADAGPKFRETMDRVNEITQKLSAGEGTLGKLLQDPEMFERFDRISQDVDKITNQIAKGEGTMGQLIFSDEGAEDMRQALEDIRTAFEEIKTVLDENRDNISEAMKGLSEIGPKLEKAVDNIDSIVAKVEQGDGTLGKLVNDPELYNEAKSAAEQLRKTLEEAEEQTVLQSFFRIFTGGI